MASDSLTSGVLNGRPDRAAPSAATPALRVRTGATTQQSWRARRRRRGILPDVDLRRLADLVEPAADAARLERHLGRGDDLRLGRFGQERDEAEVGLEQAPHLGGDGLERHRQVELVPAGAGKVVEGEDLVLAVDQLGCEQVAVPLAADERPEGGGVGFEPRHGVRLRADEPQLQLIGDLRREVRRRGGGAWRPAHDPCPSLQEAESSGVP